MRTVIHGKTELEVSRVGMGGIPIQRPPENEAIRVIRRALDLGINFDVRLQRILALASGDSA